LIFDKTNYPFNIFRQEPTDFFITFKPGKLPFGVTAGVGFQNGKNILNVLLLILAN